MPAQSFVATVERPDSVGAWTYLSVPFDAAAVFGAKGQIKVKGTLNGARFRGVLMPRGDGRHFLVVNKGLPPSHQQEYLEHIAEAKKDQTRRRRIAAAVTRLSAAKPA